MNYSFADYETAVLAALEPLRQPAGYLKTLQGYAGEFAAEEVLDLFLRGFPGILVEITEAVYERQKDHRESLHIQRATITLYLGARQWREQTQARSGEVGIYRMLADVRRLLLGNSLGLEILPLELYREAKVAADRHTVLYLAEYILINPRITKEI